ncbi:MAG: insulinase family protein [Saprospiraceae bacterium]|nr:insulinase family protein [Saprospiraceae bacterium]
MFLRRAAPLVHPVGNLSLPEPAIIRLSNGIPLYVLHFPAQEVLKVEVVFRAGRPQETKRLASRTTARLLREGTHTRTGAEIAEFFDFYGASVSVPTNLDTANVILYALSKYAAEVMPVFSDILLDPIFPETELENYRRTSIQELSVELEKVETIAYRKVTELIFGEHHPYGYNSTETDYQQINREDVQQFYRQWYRPENCLIFASGCVDENTIALIERNLGGWETGEAAASTKLPQNPNQTTAGPEKMHLPHPGSLQTAIKIGRRAFGRKHPDFNGLFVLNTILGGYFGSRLMTNIREKKGYTYNIYSTLDAYINDGCFYIATEVNPENTSAAIKAIFLEMKKLCDKLVQESELEMVKNYLLGMILNGLDGPLNASDLVKNVIVEDLPWESFSQMVHDIRTITPQGLQALARRYLQPQDFWVITVG